LSYFSHLLKRRIKRLFDNYFDLSREFNAKQQAFQLIGYRRAVESGPDFALV
jgi:hypothetical protein